MNLCQLIPTHYDKQQIKTSRAEEWIEDEGYGMNNEWQFELQFTSLFTGPNLFLANWS